MPELSYRELQRIRNIKKSAAYNRPIGDYADGQRSVGERCVECGHNQVGVKGTCSANISGHSNAYMPCGCRCIFPSAPEAQSVGERIVREFDGLIYDSDQMKLAKAINAAISKAKADTWKEAIETARAADNIRPTEQSVVIAALQAAAQSEKGK